MLKPSFARRAIQWSSTLNLPRSTFPPRALESARPAYLQKCTDELYQWQYRNRPAENQFVLHDGPPYANGELHIGHALNKILKDIICRFHISQGRRVQYIPGWDCHGLPIEVKALKGQEDSFRRLKPAQIRQKAKTLAQETIELQKQGFRNWAVLGDWQNAYQTMSKDFELRQLRVFRDMVQLGIIYRQFKPVHWSPSSGTALAEAELEYDEHHKSTAAFVKFKISKPSTSLNPAAHNVYAIIWTTTPWTLPANKAIGINKSFTYCLFHIRNRSDLYLVGKSRLAEVLNFAELNPADVTITEELSGQDIVNKGNFKYINPFRPEELRPFLHGNFVTEDSGTGLVHMAPGHGFDDYELCLARGIEPFAPVDDLGCFTSDAFPRHPELLTGMPVLIEGALCILNLLSSSENFDGRQEKEESLLWATHEYFHKYPIDWRTKLPTIIRATAQWFADVEPIKEVAFRALQDVDFLPESGRARMQSFVGGRSQWCISRQRAWGVPIPALYASDGTAIMDASTVDHIIGVIGERGIDAWWTDEENDPAWLPSDLPHAKYTRGKDTMDVWFDSGTTWTLLDKRADSALSDVYIEGTDQHRGWFQSSLLTHIADQIKTKGDRRTPKAPFNTLITHGFTLDEHGRKMSKSVGNVISPEEIMNGTRLPPINPRSRGSNNKSVQFDGMGPDALRLWVASSDYTRDVVISDITLKVLNSTLHKYRVTFKWLLGVLADYGKESNASYAEYMTRYTRLADRMALLQLQKAVNAVQTSFHRYDFVKGVGTVNAYINSDLSSFYFETAKDHIYTDSEQDRIRVQHVCFTILKSLLGMLGPILPLLVTETIDHASELLKPLLQGPDQDPLLTFQGPLELPFAGLLNLPSENVVDSLFQIHSTIKTLQEDARSAKKLRSGLECHVSIHVASDASRDLLGLLAESQTYGDLQDIFIVSSVSVENARPREVDSLPWSFSKEIRLAFGPLTGTLEVAVQPPSGDKCPRCWRWVVERQAIDTNPAISDMPHETRICSRCKEVMAEKESISGAAINHGYN